MTIQKTNKTPPLQFLACTDIEYQYSKEPTNTYYVSLFLTLSKNLRLTAYILQIYMQTCHIILRYICKFHQLNFRIAKNVYVTFFQLCWIGFHNVQKCKSKCNRLFWQILHLLFRSITDMYTVAHCYFRIF